MPGGSNANAQNAAYKNIVNDLVIDPKNSKHLLAAVGWRSGDSYNGFYESTDGGVNWTRVNTTGGLDATDIGFANFAYSADGTRLYVINQSPRKLTSLSAIPQTYLDGVYVSADGSLDGPWTRIASSDKLGATAPARRSPTTTASATAPESRPGTTSSSGSTRPTRTTFTSGSRRSTSRRTAANRGAPSARTGTSRSRAGTSTSSTRRTARAAERLPAVDALRPALDRVRHDQRQGAGLRRERRRCIPPAAERQGQRQRQRDRLGA